MGMASQYLTLMFATLAPNNLDYFSTSSLLECVAICLRDKACVAVFYRKDTNRCSVSLKVWNKESSDMISVSGLQYWSLRTKSLQLDCGTPQLLRHTSYKYTATTVNSIVTYSCNPGYNYTGTTMISVCMGNGTWVGVDGECIRYYLNIAKDKKTTQKSTSGSKSADNAVSGACAETKKQNKPWWKIDLGKNYHIVMISHTLRKDCCENRMRSLYHKVQSDCKHCPPSSCVKTSGSLRRDSTYTYECRTQRKGVRYVTFQLSGKEALTMCNVEIFIKNPLLK